MNRFVIDSSVLLAVMLGEPGADEALKYVDQGVMSSVNLAEVHSRLVKQGFSTHEAWEMVTDVLPEIVAFDQKQAQLTGDLMLKTKAYGLSLGDRACLALAILLDKPVCTTDRVWKQVGAGVSVYVIR